jgi:hypothetical protein
MPFAEVDSNEEEVAPQEKPEVLLSQVNEATTEGQAAIEQFLSNSKSTDEMQDLLDSCKGNHFWTEQEKQCLVYFLNICNENFTELHERYFQHRTPGALKTRYTKIIRGEDTPASTPRMSVGHLSEMAKQTGNEIIKAMTPRKKMQPIEEEEDEEVDPMFPAAQEGDPSVEEPQEAEVDEEFNKMMFVAWAVLGIWVIFVAVFLGMDGKYLPEAVSTPRDEFTSMAKESYDRVLSSMRQMFQ